ncbi:type II secretion system minor pseudopilin GspI [bacterium SCSIO 12696]|nr:type II secretion system minor pseudopilin GspI [bacterium SCSIO 12696]
MKWRSSIRGLALVEVLVALAVVAIALPALLNSVEGITDGTSHMRDKAMAQWIASDRLTQRAINRRLGQTGGTNSSGEVEMAGQRWQWRMVVREAPTNPNFQQVEVSVFRFGQEESLIAMMAVERK